MKKFVDVIVPLPIANQYTYSLPQEMEEMVQIGCRVVVPFGKKKFYTAIVTNVHYADFRNIEQNLKENRL